MPIQSTDTTTAIVFNADGQTWLIKPGVAVAPGSGIAVQSTHASNILVNYGMILANGNAIQFESGDYGQIINAAGASVTASYTGIANLQDYGYTSNAGTVEAYYGVEVGGYGSVLINTGVINGQVGGVFLSGESGSVQNSGRIQGGSHGLEFVPSASGLVTLDNDGTIQGGDAAIAVQSAGLDLHNNGQIIGAITCDASAGQLHVVNNGLIDGVIAMGDKGDLYDGRLGRVTDTVFGYAGADTLKGGGGQDVLDGGADRDKLDGGKGGDDVFVFDTLKDSTAKAPDTITRHWDASDLIDVSAVDADSAHAGQQHLVWGGQVAAGAALTAHALQYYQQNGSTFVVADTDGDTKADFEVIIKGTYTLTADQFAL